MPDLPGRELFNGRFTKNVQLRLGHNRRVVLVIETNCSDEGALFVNDSIIWNYQFDEWLTLAFPYASNTVYSLIRDG